MSKNQYVLGKQIARGGMAEIYLGKTVGSDAFQRICAIKRILPHYSKDKEFVKMFQDEAHICKLLQHANIVQVYDFAEVDKSYALIMEFVDGCDLRTLLSACETAKTRLSVPMALHIATSSAKALHYAHTKKDQITREPLGIVHRDVSPQNILLSFEGEIKVTDFGIASAENKLTETEPGVVKGKYSYMAPEQVTAKALDGRSDTFALAIVLWEALAMKRLFSGQTEVETIRRVQNVEINQRLVDLNSNVDEKLENIILKALKPSKDDRYQSAAEFEKELSKYLYSHYPDFTESDLGVFVQKIMSSQKKKSQENIRETLSIQTKDVSSAGFSLATDSSSSSIRQGLQLEIDHNESNTTSRSITRQDKLQTSARSRVRPKTKTNTHKISYALPKRKNAAGGFKALLTVAVIIVFIAAGLVHTKKFNLLKRKVSSITLNVSPSVFNVSDGKKNYKNVKSPFRLPMRKGSYSLIISRDGYQSKKITAGTKKYKSANTNISKIYLAKIPGAIIPVKITYERPLFVKVDNGIYEGFTPLQTKLYRKKKHKLVLNKKKGDVCYFSLKKFGPNSRATIKVKRLKNGKYTCTPTR